MPPAPKKFINEASTSVSEFIEGLLLTHPLTLQKLANHNVILSNPIKTTQVNILSGGGSGHEPSHAGWIGEGMLSGAILGGIFASPSVSSILAAIRAVTPITEKKGPGGCLLIVKNYTGDRLNFGLACEAANAEGRRTAMVVVADDCAIPRDKGVTGARGVAGTVLVHKVAGAAAAKGLSLDEVAEVARWVAGRVGSLGVALESVTIPGAKEVNQRIGEGFMEVGLGIHGEAGISQCDVVNADKVCEIMVDTILKFGYGPDESHLEMIKKGDEVVVLVNNLGGVSNFEMSILTRGAVKLLESDKIGCKVTSVLVGSFMTSFDMKGASLSILCLDKEGKIAELLNDPTTAPAWTKAEVWSKIDPRPSQTILPETLPPPKNTSAPSSTSSIPITIPNFSTLASNAITAACANIIHNESQLTAWDTIVGDGDCGITMARGANKVLSCIADQSINTASPVELFSDLADAVSASMGGTSGALIELAFRKMSVQLSQGDAIGEKELAGAFVEGVNAVSFYGGARLGSRTMVDALIPACQVIETGSGVATVADMAKAATRGADSTSVMGSAEAGRSNYLRQESLEGTPDPGAKAVAFVLEAIAGVLASH